MTGPGDRLAGPGRKYIGQGEHAIGEGQEAVITTLLGSCVSACLWDPNRGIGGMNHVLFTDDHSNAADLFGHGVNGMELLINGLQRRGADRRGLRAKVFGGAVMIDGLSSAGLRNGEFILDYLAREGIVHVGGDLGGQRARRLEFWPATGRARVKLVADAAAVPAPAAPPPDQGHDIELF